MTTDLERRDLQVVHMSDAIWSIIQGQPGGIVTQALVSVLAQVVAQRDDPDKVLRATLEGLPELVAEARKGAT